MRGRIRLKNLAVINLMNWPVYASQRYPVSYGSYRFTTQDRRQSGNFEKFKTPIYIVIQYIYQYFSNIDFWHLYVRQSRLAYLNVNGTSSENEMYLL